MMILLAMDNDQYIFERKDDSSCNDQCVIVSLVLLIEQNCLCE
jgi:hypothetical protein